MADVPTLIVGRFVSSSERCIRLLLGVELEAEMR